MILDCEHLFLRDTLANEKARVLGHEKTGNPAKHETDYDGTRGVEQVIASYLGQS